MKAVISILALIISIATCIVVIYRSENNVVYVDSGKIFNEFELAKKLNKELENTLKARQSILDTMFSKINSLTVQVKFDKLKDQKMISYLAQIEEEYYLKQKQFEEDNRASNNAYLTKVWNQLNQYIMEYGKKHRLSFVFGANGNGNIMYANEEKNITDEILTYVNDRYNDKVK